MKYALFLLFVFYLSPTAGTQVGDTGVKFFPADHPAFQYTGRIDFSNPKLPRFWQPGVYIVTQFEGSSCSIILNDEVLWGNSHNYVDIIVDDNNGFRYKMTGKTDTILAAKDLENKTHRILICKDTEAGIGYLEFVGLICNAVKPPEPKPS